MGTGQSPDPLTVGSLPLLPTSTPAGTQPSSFLLTVAASGPPVISAILLSFPYLPLHRFFLSLHLVSVPGTDLCVGTRRWQLKARWQTCSRGCVHSHSPFPSAPSLLFLFHILSSSCFPMAFSISYPLLLLLLPLPFLPSASIVLFLVHSYIYSFVHSANSDIRVLPQAARWAVEPIRRGLCLRELLAH